MLSFRRHEDGDQGEPAGKCFRPRTDPSTTNPNAASLNCSRTRACRYLWHGNVFQALRHLQFVEMDLESAAFEKQEETTRKLLKAVEEFSTYIQRNRGFIPNYGEGYRNGERISNWLRGIGSHPSGK